MRDQDSKAIKEVLAGNERSFALLVDCYKEKGMGLALRMLRNREEAEEALQDAFVRAFRALPAFKGTASFGTWFYRILFNVCHSRLESRKEPPRSIDSDEGILEEHWISDEPLPDGLFESSEMQRAIKEEIESLPEPFGSTFLLFILQELKYDEIVEITGVPLGTVKARIFRARAMVRVAMIRRFGEELDGVIAKKGKLS
jgi:RNA polymerase sigma-70 factor (ECF subfamily)